MKNIKKIIFSLTLGCSMTVQAQEANTAFNISLKDTLNVGYELQVSPQNSSYAISGVNSTIFERNSQIDITKSLYGKIPGLNVYQGTGNSSINLSELSFHGNAPLVLIDGHPRNIDDITSIEIESIYLLKDAASLALNGMRGANGVLIINSKQGIVSDPKIAVEYNFGVNTQFRSPKFANAGDYGDALNQALLGDGLDARYNSLELAALRNNSDPFNFPNVDWKRNILNNRGYAHNLKFSFTGGSERFKYFTAINYYRDRSMLKENSRDNRYSTLPTDTRLSLRTNFDVSLTNTTSMKVGLLAKLQEVNGSVVSDNDIFSSMYNTPSAAFPIRYSNNIYGGSSVYGDKNPVALLKDKGHVRHMYGSLLADLSLTQKLDVITEGLSANMGIAFDNIGGMQESSHKEYRYMHTNPSLLEGGYLVTKPVVYGKDSKELGHKQPFERLLMRNDFHAKLVYDRAFNNHKVSAATIYNLQSVIRQGRNNTRKNQSFVTTATYNYADKYIVSGVVNIAGSAYLPDNDKYRTYPAVSAAWVVSNEDFLKENEVISYLKIKASHGLMAWDGGLSHELWRSSYGGGNHYFFGENASKVWGSSEGNLPVEGLTVEKSRKTTFGLDMELFKSRLSLGLDYFYDKRSDVLVSGSNSTSGIIGIGVGLQNAGKYEYQGFDGAIRWNDKKGDFSYAIGGTFSYLTSKIINDNQAYQEYDYLYHKGNRLGQKYGLEVVGFFQDQMDINNSPSQTFSTVAPGDIKYKDQNGDNVIDEKDVVKMFGSGMPRFYFGFDFTLAYKNFEVYADFQGLTGVTVSLLNSPLYKPLVNNGNISKTFLNRETPWSMADKENATMPRLTTLENKNNYRQNSLWYKDGSFIKLRSLVLSYTFKKEMTRFADVKVFVEGNNLFSLDNIRFTDPEQLQMGYPSTRSFWTGVKFNF